MRSIVQSFIKGFIKPTFPMENEKSKNFQHQIKFEKRCPNCGAEMAAENKFCCLKCWRNREKSMKYHKDEK